MMVCAQLLAYDGVNARRALRRESMRLAEVEERLRKEGGGTNGHVPEERNGEVAETESEGEYFR